MCVSFIFIYLTIIYIVIAVVSNKSDLFDKEQVSEEEGKKFADEKNLPFFSVSAYSGAGVFLLFETNERLPSLLRFDFIELVND